MTFVIPLPVLSQESWKQGSDEFKRLVHIIKPKGMDYYFIKLLAGDPIPIREKMMFEGNRLRSFLKWPQSSPIHPPQFCRAGFYYSDIGDEVICFACEGRIKNWEVNDDPIQVHMERFPFCPFITGELPGVNFQGNLDKNHPLMQTARKIEEMIKRTSETNRELALRTTIMESPNEIASTNIGQIIRKRGQNIAVTRDSPREATIIFRDEKERLRTFEGSWNNLSPVTPKALVQAGFFYCGLEDIVQCAWCYGKLGGWEQCDDPLVEHVKHFPNCSKFGDRKGVVSASLLITNIMQGDSDLNSDDLGILTMRPCNPQLTIEATRFDSFRNKWPTNLTQKPEQLAAAGYFYIGYADNVKCFFCDGGLCNWEDNDDPWTEHARWFPECGFLKQVKGPEFIQKVQEIGINGGSINSGGENVHETSEPHAPPRMDKVPSSSTQSLESKNLLEKENEKLKEQRTCKICMNGEVSIVLLPCGHLVSCVKCTPALKNCPICRIGIKGTVRTFMA